MNFEEIYKEYEKDIVIIPVEEEKKALFPTEEIKEQPAEETISDEILASKWLGLDYKELTAQQKIDYAGIYLEFKKHYSDPERDLRHLESEWGSLGLGETRISRIKRHLKTKTIIDRVYK